MIALPELVRELSENGVNFATGVPDSLIGQIGATLEESLIGIKHITAVNEGAAVGLAIGSYLATGKLPIIYMQNSGLGNALNPLVSLAGSSAFKVPLLLLIGWRGEMGLDGVQIRDEPQHAMQGSITPSLLEQLEIPFLVLDSTSSIREVVALACQTAVKRSLPFAILVRKGTLKANTFPSSSENGTITRRRAIEVVCESFGTEIPVIATTGMISRELFDFRRSHGQIFADLLCVGGMGHAVSIASGFASMRSGPVLLLDGDGAAQMHLGAQLTASSIPNLIHVILNNRGHASVGGQETAAPNLNFSNLAPHLGYENSFHTTTEVEVKASVGEALGLGTSSLVEVMCTLKATPELGRPEDHPSVNAQMFQEKAATRQ